MKRWRIELPLLGVLDACYCGNQTLVRGDLVGAGGWELGVIASGRRPRGDPVDSSTAGLLQALGALAMTLAPSSQLLAGYQLHLRLPRRHLRTLLTPVHVHLAPDPELSRQLIPGSTRTPLRVSAAGRRESHSRRDEARTV